VAASRHQARNSLNCTPSPSLPSVKRNVQKSRILHRNVAVGRTTTWRVHKSDANVSFPPDAIKPATVADPPYVLEGHARSVA
jgi:hypothetical protein